MKSIERVIGYLEAKKEEYQKYDDRDYRQTIAYFISNLLDYIKEDEKD